MPTRHGSHVAPLLPSVPVAQGEQPVALRPQPCPPGQEHNVHAPAPEPEYVPALHASTVPFE